MVIGCGTSKDGHVEMPKYADDPKWPFVAGLQNCREQLEPVDCEISGDFPNWLNGVLFRAGPGVFDIKINNRIASFQHWFDAIAMIHRF